MLSIFAFDPSFEKSKRFSFVWTPFRSSHVQKKEMMGSQIKAASFSLTVAKKAAGDTISYALSCIIPFISPCRQTVIQNTSQASFTVREETDNVVGVHLPVFEAQRAENQCI